MTLPTSIETLGDRALLVRFKARPSRSLTGLLAALSSSARELDGVIDAAPGHRTVLVEVEPTRRELVARQLPGLVEEARPTRGTLHRVEIRYDGEDLGWVCNTANLSVDEFKSIHSRKTYDVRMIGSPGFIYLSTVDRRLVVPRMEEPRTVVPQGSVGIGGRQTGIYGLTRPGGWRLIGSVGEVPKVQPGDRIRFVPT